MEQTERFRRLVALVPWSTGEVLRRQKLAGDPSLPPDAAVEVDTLDVVEQRLVEANDADARLSTWADWAARLRATLAAQGSGEPYSRVRVDAVMADCPLRVEGEVDGGKD